MPSATQNLSGSCQITVTRYSGINLLSAGDVIYPPVDDPYAVGKAACAHCLSPLYACGVSEVDSVNLTITTSTKLSDRERDVILPQIVLGFQECCAEAGANMTQSPIGKFNNFVAGYQVKVQPWTHPASSVAWPAQQSIPASGFTVIKQSLRMF